MKIEKFGTLLFLITTMFLIIINWYLTNYYHNSYTNMMLIGIVIFAYIPAIIALLYVLTDGWILRGFLDPIDYGYWDKSKR